MLLLLDSLSSQLSFSWGFLQCVGKVAWAELLNPAQGSGVRCSYLWSSRGVHIPVSQWRSAGFQTSVPSAIMFSSGWFSIHFLRMFLLSLSSKYNPCHYQAMEHVFNGPVVQGILQKGGSDIAGALISKLIH